MSSFLNTKLGAIHDRGIFELIKELEAICGVPCSNYLDYPLRTFLSLCVYPGGTGTKRVRLSTATVPQAPLLDSRIGKLPSGLLFDLCEELSISAGQGREFTHDQKLVALLNLTIDKHTPTKPLTERQRLEERIVQRRRRNR